MVRYTAINSNTHAANLWEGHHVTLSDPPGYHSNTQQYTAIQQQYADTLSSKKYKSNTIQYIGKYAISISCIGSVFHCILVSTCFFQYVKIRENTLRC